MHIAVCNIFVTIQMGNLEIKIQMYVILNFLYIFFIMSQKIKCQNVLFDILVQSVLNNI